MRIYLDTSAINHITNDSSKPKIVSRLRNKYEPIISSLIIGELISTPNDERRYKLFNTLSSVMDNTVLKGRKMLYDEPTILRLSLETIIDETKKVDYFKYRGDYSELPFLSNPHTVCDGKYLNIAREAFKKFEDRHIQHLRSRRSKIQEESKFFPDYDKSILKSRRADFFRFMSNNHSLLNNLISDALQNPNYVFAANALKGREFEVIEKSEFWRFHFVAFFLEIYNRLYRLENYSPKRNPGWVDTRQAVYLAATDVFVTADVRQRNFFRILAKFAINPKKVWSYNSLKKELLG
jgi:hypothetical protein